MTDIHGFLLRTTEGDVLITSEELDTERLENIMMAHEIIGHIEVADETMEELNRDEVVESEDNISPDPDYPINVGVIDDIDDIDDDKYNDVVSDVYNLLEDYIEDASDDDDYDYDDMDDDDWDD